MDKAERLVKEELHRLGWRELDLEAYRKERPRSSKSPRAYERRPP
jgi:hypothetical protein